MDRLAIPKIAHMETLRVDDLPRLMEKREAILKSIECDEASETAHLHEIILWLTEQIVYIKAALRGVDL